MEHPESIEETIALMDSLPEADQLALKNNAILITGEFDKWAPNPGPQHEAYYCKADILFYGGQGGGGKTDLECGLALTSHRKSLIMRRQYTDLGGIIERALEINGTRNGFNGQPPPKLKTSDGRLIEFGAAKHLGDEQSWQGQPHDLLAIDEVTQFLEIQVRMLMGWVRSTIPGQQTRTIFGSNPPSRQMVTGSSACFAPGLTSTTRTAPRTVNSDGSSWILTARM